MTDQPPKPDASAFPGDRIAKVIARAGVCSRRDAERLIGEGKVAVNGKVLTSPAVNVTERDMVTVNGKPLPGANRCGCGATTSRKGSSSPRVTRRAGRRCSACFPTRCRG